jgi:hypothetical protein
MAHPATWMQECLILLQALTPFSFCLGLVSNLTIGLLPQWLVQLTSP